MPPSSYRPWSEEQDEIEAQATPRASAARSVVPNSNGSARKKKTLIEELGGQQVITTQHSTSYGSGAAVKPIAIKRTFEGQDLATQMRNIMGTDTVPLSRSTPKPTLETWQSLT